MLFILSFIIVATIHKGIINKPHSTVNVDIFLIVPPWSHFIPSVAPWWLYSEPLCPLVADGWTYNKPRITVSKKVPLHDSENNLCDIERFSRHLQTLSSSLRLLCPCCVGWSKKLLRNPVSFGNLCVKIENHLKIHRGRSLREINGKRRGGLCVLR